MTNNTLVDTQAPTQPKLKIGKVFDEKAEKIIRNFTLAATGAGLAPNPLLSVGVSVTSQVLMIRELCELYEVSFEKNRTSILINSVIGSVLTEAISRIVARMVSGTDTTKGLDISGAGVCGLYTATVGEFYKTHFEKGGTLKDANLSDLGSYFMQEIEKGDIGLSSISNPSAIMGRLIK